MSENKEEIVREIMLAVFAAVRGEDQVAGDHLRKVSSRMAEQVIMSRSAPLFGGAVSPPGRSSDRSRGETEPELTGEE